MVGKGTNKSNMQCPVDARKVSFPCSDVGCLMHAGRCLIGLPPVLSNCLLLAASAGGDEPVARLRSVIGMDGRKGISMNTAAKAISSFGAALQDYHLMLEFLPPAGCPECGYTAAGRQSTACKSKAICRERKSAIDQALLLFEDLPVSPTPEQLWEAVVAKRDAHLPAGFREALRQLVGQGDQSHQTSA